MSETKLYSSRNGKRRSQTWYEKLKCALLQTCFLCKTRYYISYLMAFTRNVMYNQLCYIKFAEEELRLLLTFLNFRGQHFRLLWQIKNYWWPTFSRKRQICFTVLTTELLVSLWLGGSINPPYPESVCSPALACSVSYNSADWNK